MAGDAHQLEADGAPAERGFRIDLVLLFCACAVGLLLGLQPIDKFLPKDASSIIHGAPLLARGGASRLVDGAGVVKGSGLGASAFSSSSGRGDGSARVRSGDLGPEFQFLRSAPMGYDGGIRLRQTTSEFRELLLGGLLSGDLNYTSSEVDEIASVLNASRAEFWGALRGAQRPFQAHHIAVASGMLMLRAPVHMVKAALMHSTFGFGRTGGQGVLVDTREKLCRRRQRLRSIVGPASEYLIFMDQSFPSDDFNAHGIETLHMGWAAGLLTPAQEDMTRLWLINEMDEYDPTEQFILTTRQRKAPFIARAVELAGDLLGAQFAHALWARYNATYAVVDNVAVGEGSSYEKWGTLTADVSPRLKSLIKTLRKYNADLRPRHSQYYFTRNVGRLYSDEIVGRWDDYWAEFECQCCSVSGGPCPADVAYYYPERKRRDNGAAVCPPDRRGYGGSGSATPRPRRVGSASRSPHATRSPGSTHSHSHSPAPPSPAASAATLPAGSEGDGAGDEGDHVDVFQSHGQEAAHASSLPLAEDDDAGAPEVGAGGDEGTGEPAAAVASASAPEPNR